MKGKFIKDKLIKDRFMKESDTKSKLIKRLFKTTVVLSLCGMIAGASHVSAQEIEEVEVLQETATEQVNKNTNQNNEEVILQAAGAKTSGKFLFGATTQEDSLVEPTWISYNVGDTLYDAVTDAGYSIHFQNGSVENFLDTVEGHVDNYCVVSDTGVYKFTEAADSLSYLFVTTNTDMMASDNLGNLLKVMADYKGADEGLRNYIGAQTAYNTALEKIYNASPAQMKTLADQLKEAMDKYQAYISGKKIPLKMSIKKSGKVITTGTIELTGEYGNKISGTNLSEIQVVAGRYQFDVSDGGYAHVRGTIEVGPDTVLKVILPDTNWIDTVELGLASNYTEAEQVKAAAQVSGSMKRTYYIPDYAGPNIYPYVVRADIVKNTYQTKCGIYYTGSDVKKNWESRAASLRNAIDSYSLETKNVVLEARLDYKELDSSSTESYEAYETYTMKIVRTPSLKSLSILADQSNVKLDFTPDQMDYAFATISDNFTIKTVVPQVGAELFINNKAATPAQDVVLTLSELQKDSKGNYKLPITLNAPNGQKTTYTVTITKYNPCEMTVLCDTDVDLQIKNAGGSVIAEKSKGSVSGKNQYKYSLVPGENYTYVTTKNTYFHCEGTFKAAEGGSITCKTPQTDDGLTSLETRANNNLEANMTLFTPLFTPSVHEYETVMGSTTAAVYMKVIAKENMSVTAQYYSMNTGEYKEISYAAGSTSSKNLTYILNQSGNTALLALKVWKTEGDILYYQDYKVTMKRLMQLSDLSVTANDISLPFYLSEDEKTSVPYSEKTTEYTMYVGQRVPEVKVSIQPISTNNSQMRENQYPVAVVVRNDPFKEVFKYDAEHMPNTVDVVSVPLHIDVTEETIEVEVSFDDSQAIAQNYKLHLVKLPSIASTVTVTPKDANIYLFDNTTKSRVLPENNGTYTLNSSGEYTLSATKAGYVGQEKVFIANDSSRNINLRLEAVQEQSTTDIAKEGDWLGFRQNDTNNGVVNVKSPIKAEDAVLTWANKIGDGYASGAVGCPILVDGYLYTYAGNNIVKVNKETGEIVAKGIMAGASSFAITPPTYGDGKIFVGLSNGKVQAFNAITLESLWIYEDRLKGQSNCPIAYKDGYVYTGFWNSEEKSANFVCLSATDENPKEPLEKKIASWTYEDNGFYWAGAYVSDKYVLVPTDDGASGYITGTASLLSIDPKTGYLIDRVKMSNVGDLRSSVCYDKDTDAFYFTSSGGDFYKIQTNADGTFKEKSLRRLHLNNGATDKSNPPMSSSTPVIYHGRAYIGVAGTGQFVPYSGHNMTVIDLNNFQIAYTIPTQGYPKTSGLLTTAYEKDEEYIYVYFVDNYTPGKVRVLRDKKGMTEMDPEYTTKETYMENGKEKEITTGYVLFTPSGSQAQYSICSLIIDSEGNLYFKNDSAQLMCLSNRMTSLEVIKAPIETCYDVGEVFDGTGMEVIAHYANGLTKDVTKYISYSTDPLTKDDTEITISFEPDKLLNGKEKYWEFYQDKGGEAGVTYHLPTTSVEIDISNCDHKWSAEDIKPAGMSELLNDKAADWENVNTDEADGIFRATCSVCHRTRTRVIPAVATITLSKDMFVYNGKAQKPKVVVTDRKGNVLTKNVDYTVKYSAGLKAIGSYTCKVTFIGKYEGVYREKFSITPPIIKFTKLAAGTKSFTAKWAKLSAAKKKLVTGFQIQYSTSSKMKNAKLISIKKNTATSQVVKSLKKETAYYVQIRTYKKVNGKVIPSEWSSKKKVVVK